MLHALSAVPASRARPPRRLRRAIDIGRSFHRAEVGNRRRPRRQSKSAGCHAPAAGGGQPDRETRPRRRPSRIDRPIRRRPTSRIVRGRQGTLPASTIRNPGRGQALARLLLVLLLALLPTACATLPDQLPPARLGVAQPPAADGPLADAERAVYARLGATKSGFHLLDTNGEGLRWRLALIDSAQHSLDLQYYIWWNDESGMLLMQHVVAAADRGVKVRLILDDLTTILEDEEHPKLRDASFALVNSNPNIDIRLFNAWHHRGMAGRAVEMLEQMERLNHRMHNKLLVADNRAAIIGGRNLGNEYFGLSERFNFLDLDVLTIGPAARQASAVFDMFWNSDWVVREQDLGIAVTPEALASLEADVRRVLLQSPDIAALPVDPVAWDGELAAMVAAMQGGASIVHSDAPDPGELTHHMPRAIREMIGSATSEVLIVNAYIIPDQTFVDQLAGMTARGVRVRMLTNSLASHDVPAVNSHYKQWRGPLVDAGVELHEVRHDAAVQHELADTPPVAAGFMGLHIKAIVVDRTRVFIGSMNLDPRSQTLNSEMGIIVYSPQLAAIVAERFATYMAPENAWQVSRGADGGLRWTAGDEVLTRQPARGAWQRVQDLMFMAFPEKLY
ncbi:MAG: phospholipase D family protein [Geminicoccaceae bacterium]